MENKTALTQLRDKLLVTCQELKEPSIGNEHLKGYREALKNVANDIDAQMLAIEQKQIEDAYNTAIERPISDYDYYSQTFKSKE